MRSGPRDDLTRPVLRLSPGLAGGGAGAAPTPGSLRLAVLASSRQAGPAAGRLTRRRRGAGPGGGMPSPGGKGRDRSRSRTRACRSRPPRPSSYLFSDTMHSLASMATRRFGGCLSATVLAPMPRPWAHPPAATASSTSTGIRDIMPPGMEGTGRWRTDDAENARTPPDCTAVGGGAKAGFCAREAPPPAPPLANCARRGETRSAVSQAVAHADRVRPLPPGPLPRSAGEGETRSACG